MWRAVVGRIVGGMAVTELVQDQCEALLNSGVAGRVAVCTPDGPHLIPVNYAVVDGSVVIRTAPYSRLATYGPGSVLAFEVDQFDYENQRGWSVVARGRAHQIGDLIELEHVRATWIPRPWADGDRNFFIGFAWSEISGRQLGSGWVIEDGLAVKRMPPRGHRPLTEADDSPTGSSNF